MKFRGREITKPTLEEIKEYVQAKHLLFDPVEFYNYYEERGWKRKNGQDPKTVESLISVFNADFLRKNGIKSYRQQKKDSATKNEKQHNIESQNINVKKFIAYTDGSCDNLNPKRPGGSAYVILNEDGSIYKKASKGFIGTTNNRMELLAIISVVNSIPEGCDVEIYTDSQYCITTLKSRKPKKNLDLVQLYHSLAEKLSKVTFEWIKGHNGNFWNEECDRMANGEYQKQL